MKTIALKPSGDKMPLVGMGLWKVDKENCKNLVYTAICNSYRMLDNAADYGNEKEVGEGIKQAIDEGKVKREDLFVTTKLWCTFHDPEHVRSACKRSLEDLGLKYVDLYLMHFPVSLEYVDPTKKYPSGWGNCKDGGVPIHETWKAMEQLVTDGLVKNIGISNFQGSLIIDLLRCAKIKPAVLQIEHHPYLTQQPLIELCEQQGIAVIGYSSFGPTSFIELKWDSATKTPSLFEHKTITSIAQKHKVTPAQVLLRWATQRGIAVIPKSNKDDRLIQNFQSSDFDLHNDELNAISALDCGLRFNNPGDYADPKIYIFS